jgi:hypothetical protein
MVRDRRDGRFFGRRVNCEQVPLLPAWAVGWMLDDPRKIPYLLVWKRDGAVQEAVRVSSRIDPPVPFSPEWTGVFEIKRTDGTRNFIRTLTRPLPRNGAKARFLVCPYCQSPRRALYGWEPDGQYTNSTRPCSWRCRRCAGLRHASEGGALVHRGRGVLFRMLEAAYGPCRSERPDPWYPHVFTNPDHYRSWMSSRMVRKIK